MTTTTLPPPKTPQTRAITAQMLAKFGRFPAGDATSPTKWDAFDLGPSLLDVDAQIDDDYGHHSEKVKETAKQAARIFAANALQSHAMKKQQPLPEAPGHSFKEALAPIASPSLLERLASYFM